jgi:hypothetical protein
VRCLRVQPIGGLTNATSWVSTGGSDLGQRAGGVVESEERAFARPARSRPITAPERRCMNPADGMTPSGGGVVQARSGAGPGLAQHWPSSRSGFHPMHFTRSMADPGPVGSPTDRIVACSKE